MDPQRLLNPHFIHAQRVARLATADSSGIPHIVPICFAYDGTCFYLVLDQKPKHTSWTHLKRVRNIRDNPEVTLLLDHYEEEWEELWYLLVWGRAELLQGGDDHQQAIQLLRAKYAQYRQMDIEENPVIRITPRRMAPWSGVTPAEGETSAS